MIKPLGNNILIRQLKTEELTASGIVLIESNDREKKAEGEVVEVGPGRLVDGEREPMEVSVGDTVLFPKWGGDEVEAGGVEYKIISSEDVLAIIIR